MSLRNLIKRIDAIERQAPRNPLTKIALIVSRAQQIAARTNYPLDLAIGAAIEELGTPLRIADVDSLMGPNGGAQS